MPESSIPSIQIHTPTALYQGDQNSDKMNEWQRHEVEILRQERQQLERRLRQQERD
ncbi:hypothetical protein [Litoribrevibacter albus]|uniref:Uncharacterized protein n=1 Tax=Litoribrevibacter albus TaxID=1473156 RepID=A0AA37SDX2_9GAMM|nr:hypothetical protein [Litoribrevibacter albus]GLQ32763.1 hypothetical protein GCM10007876_32420 [Litoribrevibacter albus]